MIIEGNLLNTFYMPLPGLFGSFIAYKLQILLTALVAVQKYLLLGVIIFLFLCSTYGEDIHVPRLACTIRSSVVLCCFVLLFALIPHSFLFPSIMLLMYYYRGGHGA